MCVSSCYLILSSHIHHYGLLSYPYSTSSLSFSGNCMSFHYLNGWLFLFLSPLEGYLWFPLHNDYLCFWPRLFLLVVVSPYQVSLQIPHLQGKCSEGGNGRRGTGGWQTIQTLSMSVAVMGKGKQGRSWKVMWGQYIFLLKWSKLYLCVLRMLKICILLTYSGRKTDDGGRGGDFLQWCPSAHETTQSVRHQERGWTELGTEFQGHGKEHRPCRGSSMGTYGGGVLRIYLLIFSVSLVTMK